MGLDAVTCSSECLFSWGGMVASAKESVSCLPLRVATAVALTSDVMQSSQRSVREWQAIGIATRLHAGYRSSTFVSKRCLSRLCIYTQSLTVVQRLCNNLASDKSGHWGVPTQATAHCVGGTRQCGLLPPQSSLHLHTFANSRSAIV